MSRALWKGAISFGLVHVPVQLHSAEKRNTLDFDLLDRRDMHPVGYQRINKETGKVVPWEEIVKGYEHKKGEYVVVTDEDFRRANVEATQTIDIINFVNLADIPLIYFDTPYYLAPGRGGDKGYALMRQTLKRADKAGIAQVVIRSRQRLAALVPDGDMLILNTLRYDYEIRPHDDIDLPAGKKAVANAREVAMALKLVEEMTDEWRPEKYHDTYREDLLKHIRKKIKSGDTETVAEPEEPAEKRKSAEVIDLVSLLKRSIGQAKQDGGGGRGEADAEPARHRRRKRA
jgi:DNA end-binding protein Ku